MSNNFDTSKSLVLQVQVTGNEETRISPRTNKPYTQAEAFVMLPGIPYPQRFRFYCATQSEVPRAGFYECEVEISIKNDNLEFRCDPRRGTRVAEPSKPTA